MLDTGAKIDYNYSRSWGGSHIQRTYRLTARKPFLGGYPVTGGISHHRSESLLTWG